jgi:hypothetical protein
MAIKKRASEGEVGCFGCCCFLVIAPRHLNDELLIFILQTPSTILSYIPPVQLCINNIEARKTGRSMCHCCQCANDRPTDYTQQQQ